ncbi:unnamed protein product [Schistosoma margrebowiei]|uniref:Tetraspanin n=1 Tax=Schistosoma margrebowiei TaxID=48269 RepID=A0AA84ZRM9_9TREM|nr:unnamed protein product [Schistosoma margrebowiei]
MASLSCGYKCLQILLVIFNIFVCVCGIVAVVIGSFSQLAINEYSNEIESNIKYLVIFVIAFGCFLFVLGFLGFFGLATKNTFCLILYTSLLSVIATAEIMGGLAIVVLRNDVETQFQSMIKSSVSEYSKNPDIKEFLDGVQQEFHCCGSESSKDYTLTNQTIPDSCKNPETKVTYSDGCSYKVISFFEKYIVAVLVAAFVFAILQLLCIVFAICVIQAIKSGNSRQGYRI